jgi:hypothetical protein
MTISEQIKFQIEGLTKTVASLSLLWDSMISVSIPKEQFYVWLSLHDAKTVVYGIKETGAKFQRARQNMDANYLLRFASKVMLNRQDRDTGGTICDT